MNAPRWVLLALCLAVPALSYRAGGQTLWLVHGAGCLVAAGIAVWLLREDGILGAAFQYKSGDPALALVAAFALYASVAAAVAYWLAPAHLYNGYLRVCGPQGAWLPRPDVRGPAMAAGEWLRDKTCEAYFRSAGVRGWQRGALVALLAACEEVAWRGGVQQVLSERLGSTRAWLAASLLFGLAHLGTGNAVVALLALAGGLAWGGLYLLRGRLLPAVLSHVAFSFALFYNNPLFVVRYDVLGP